METSEILNVIMFAITAVSILFAVWFKVRTPQEKLEKNQAINDERDKSKATVLAQKELETKALVLAEQVKNKDIENERRFSEMGTSIKEAFAIAQNHINTIETEVKNQTVTINAMCNKVIELGTIINERIPCKK